MRRGVAAPRVEGSKTRSGCANTNEPAARFFRALGEAASVKAV